MMTARLAGILAVAAATFACNKSSPTAGVPEKPVAATFKSCAELSSAFKTLDAAAAEMSNQFGDGWFIVSGVAQDDARTSGDGALRVTITDADGKAGIRPGIRVQFAEGLDRAEVAKTVRASSPVRVKCERARDIVGDLGDLAVYPCVPQ